MALPEVPWEVTSFARKLTDGTDLTVVQSQALEQGEARERPPPPLLSQMGTSGKQRPGGAPSLGRGRPWAGPHPFPRPCLCVVTLSPSRLHVACDHLQGRDNCLLRCLDPSMCLSTWWSQPSGAQDSLVLQGTTQPLCPSRAASE